MRVLLLGHQRLTFGTLEAMWRNVPEPWGVRRRRTGFYDHRSTVRAAEDLELPEPSVPFERSGAPPGSLRVPIVHRLPWCPLDVLGRRV